jgi:hypothetical protein
MSTTVDTLNLHHFADDLDACACLFGELKPETRARLFAAIEDPSETTWDDAARAILNWDKGLTLWQAVIAVDPAYADAHGPVTDESGTQLSGWTRIPAAATIRAAIHYAANAQVTA